jgi:hypothetical protein
MLAENRSWKGLKNTLCFGDNFDVLRRYVDDESVDLVYPWTCRMNRSVTLMLVLGFSLAVIASGWAAESNSEQAKAIAELEKLGGKVTIDDRSPDKPVIDVELTGTEVTDAGLEHLKGLTTLQMLDLSGTEVTDAGLEHLKGLAKLRTLDLAVTKVTDAGLVHLKGLTELQSLDVGGTRVTGAGLEHLKGLTKLQSLNLLWTRVTDAGLEHLKGLTKLRTLSLSETKVTDAGLDHLKGLTELHSLDLSNTAVADTGLKQVKELTKLQSLDLAVPQEFPLKRFANGNRRRSRRTGACATDG